MQSRTTSVFVLALFSLREAGPRLTDPCKKMPSDALPGTFAHFCAALDKMGEKELRKKTTTRGKMLADLIKDTINDRKSISQNETKQVKLNAVLHLLLPSMVRSTMFCVHPPADLC